VDAGVGTGDEITPHYDAMIAKVIAHGDTRARALERLAAALDATFVAGPRSNLAFLRRLAATRSFREADLDTALIGREQAALAAGPAPPSEALWQAAVAAWLLEDDGRPTPATPPPGSPWAARDGFRLVGVAQRALTLETGGLTRKAVVEYHVDGWRVSWAAGADGAAVTDPAPTLLAATEGRGDCRLTLTVDGSRRSAFVAVRRGTGHGGTVHAGADGEEAIFTVVDPRDAAAAEEDSDNGLRAPMPGRVVAVMVEAGTRVKRGAPLLALEAMKMEHVILAPADGVVARVLASVGAQVAEGAALVEFQPG
jgi:3-methylcrotonyl-CoA carboxylase alpha subunit